MSAYDPEAGGIPFPRWWWLYAAALILAGLILSGCEMHGSLLKKNQSDTTSEVARIFAEALAAQQHPSPAPVPDNPISGATECMTCAATAPGAAYQCLPTPCPKATPSSR